MNKHEWMQVLARIPSGLKSLREPVARQKIDALERDLHCSLPDSYRAFLELHDGGQIADLQILGVEDLKRIDLGSLPEHLLPFHPVAPDDYECFDTSRPDEGEYPVVWYSRGADSEESPTYTGFTDWLLDQLLDIVGPGTQGR